jgi:DNA-binding YbaB/EbfC family protein
MRTGYGGGGAEAFDRVRAGAPCFANVAAMGMDMNKLLQQVGEMQQQMQQAQDELAKETVDASAGGGMVTVTANGAGEIQKIKIDPKAIDPNDPEMLEDMVLAAVNEAIRSAQSLAESKLGGLAGGALGGLGLPGLGT